MMTTEEKIQIVSNVFDKLAETSSKAMLFKQAFEHSLLPSAIVAPDGKFIEVNSALCELLGHEPRELTKLTWIEVTHTADIGTDLYLANECREGKRKGYRLKKRYITKTGETKLCLFYVSYIDDGVEPFFLSNILNLSESEEVCRIGKH